MCQRATGARPRLGFSFPRRSFRLTSGATRGYASSRQGIWHFCAECGTPLFFEPVSQPRQWEVLAGTLDDPSSCAPALHIWTSSAMPWLDIRDHLPRFPCARPGA